MSTLIHLPVVATRIALVLVAPLLTSCGITDGSNSGPQKGMVRIAAAGKSFQQGDAGGRHTRGFRKVTLTRDFLMDRTEVTRRMYRDAMHNVENPDSLDYPISGISWFDAVLYCNARSKAEGLDTFFTYDSVDIYCRNGNGECHPYARNIWGLKFDLNGSGYRFPTLAEWDYALRGSDTAEYFWGDSTGYREYAWLRNGTDSSIHPVAKKKPNPRGLYDMIGNLFEHTLDSGNGWDIELGQNADAVDPLVFENDDRYRGAVGGRAKDPASRLTGIGSIYYSPSFGDAAGTWRYGGIRCVRNE